MDDHVWVLINERPTENQYRIRGVFRDLGEAINCAVTLRPAEGQWDEWRRVSRDHWESRLEGKLYWLALRRTVAL